MNQHPSPQDNQRTQPETVGQGSLTELKAPRPVKEELIVAGDPSVGRILLFGQIHFISSHEFDRARMLETGAFQAQLLQEYSSRGVRNLFAEGRTMTLAADGDPPSYYPPRVEIQALFQKSVPETFTPEQLLFLGRWGAAHVWWAVDGRVTIHPTTDPSFESETASIIDDHKRPIVEREQQKMWGREVRAMRSVVEFLRENPGAEVGIVYGLAHQFGAAHFKELLGDAAHPELFRIEPTLEVRPVSEPSFKRSLTAEEQAKVLEARSSVGYYELGDLETPELVLKAYAKIAAELRYNTPESVIDSLRATVKKFGLIGSEFEAKVERDFREQSGPFAGLFPRSDLPWAEVPRMSPYEFGKVLDAETHVPTQRALVCLGREISTTQLYKLATPDIQLKALPKLRLSGAEFEENCIEEVGKRLRSSAKGDDVRFAIDQQLPRLALQLTEVEVGPITERLLPEFRPQEVRDILGSCMNRPTQELILSRITAISAASISRIMHSDLRIQALDKVIFEAGESNEERLRILKEQNSSEPYQSELTRRYQAYLPPFLAPNPG